MILNKKVGVFLNLVHCRFKQYLTEVFQKHSHNLTPEQFLVMDTLWDEGLISQQQIAQFIKKDKNSITKLIDVLEKKGLVVRVPDTQDRRQNFIDITAEARDMKDEITIIANDAIESIIKDIPEAELDIFIKVLSKMASNMNQDTNFFKTADNGETI